jgi:hypothetical protein
MVSWPQENWRTMKTHHYDQGCLSSLNQNRQAVSPPLSTKVTAEIDISKLPLD